MDNFYVKKKKYTKYDSEQYLLYLNAETAEKKSEDGETLSGYAYAGDMEDGGTLIEAKSATYPEFVSGLIRKEYDASAESAVQSNRLVALIEPTHERAGEYIANWEAFQAYRALCKEQAKKVLLE
jgi:predicted Ser/Thr protein kinase